MDKKTVECACNNVRRRGVTFLEILKEQAKRFDKIARPVHSFEDYIQKTANMDALEFLRYTVLTLTFEKIGDKKSVINVGDKCQSERNDHFLSYRSCGSKVRGHRRVYRPETVPDAGLSERDDCGRQHRGGGRQPQQNISVKVVRPTIRYTVNCIPVKTILEFCKHEFIMEHL